MVTPIYTPPNPGTVQEYLAAAPQGLPADHRILTNTIYQVANTAGTQRGKALTVALVPQASLSNKIEAILNQPASDPPAQVVCLTIVGVPAPANRTAFLRVFINDPAPTLDTPVGDLHHVRDVAFFCCGSEGMQMSFYFEVTPNLRKLAANGESPARGFNLQLLAGAIRGDPGLIIPPLFQLAIAAV
jgi:hypothetical protein